MTFIVVRTPLSAVVISEERLLLSLLELREGYASNVVCNALGQRMNTKNTFNKNGVIRAILDTAERYSINVERGEDDVLSVRSPLDKIKRIKAELTEKIDCTE